MSKIAILTDSSCDIPQELAQKYGIDIMGFHILLDDEDIVEREKYTPEEIIGKLAFACGLQASPAPTTPQALARTFDWSQVPKSDIVLPENLF